LRKETYLDVMRSQGLKVTKLMEKDFSTVKNFVYDSPEYSFVVLVLDKNNRELAKSWYSFYAHMEQGYQLVRNRVPKQVVCMLLDDSTPELTFPQLLELVKSALELGLEKSVVYDNYGVNEEDRRLLDECLSV